MWFYFAIFFFIVSFGAAYKYRLTRQSLWLYYFLWFLLFIIAGFRGSEVDNDYHNYINAVTTGWGVVEPSFYIIAHICYNLLGSIKLVFIFYSLLSVSLLFLALKRLAPYFFLSLTIYFCTSYMLHDLNQIRAGVGVGFALLSLIPWSQNKVWKTIGYILCATLFHFSFALFLPLVFLVKNNNKNILLYIISIPFVYILYVIGIDVLSLLTKVPIPYVQIMAINYSEWSIDIVNTVNVLSMLVLIKLMIIALLVLFSKRLSQIYSEFYLYLKMYILGFFFLIFMAALPGAAFRLADLFWIVECLLLPMLLAIFKPRWLMVSFLLVLCTYWMWLNYISSNFVRPYYFDFNL